MFKLFTAVLFLLLAPFCWAAEDHVRLNFELLKDGNRVNVGTLIASNKNKTWSNGLKRSYLQLHCQNINNKTVKLYSTVDHFAGLVISHQYQGEKLIIELTQTSVVPFFNEIREMKDAECRELKPVVTRFHSKFEIEAENTKGNEKMLENGFLFRYSVSRFE